MKRNLTLITACLTTATGLWAQCTFTPTVTPNNLILCPNDSAELTTQEYDSYQWYKGSDPIAGATSQTLMVHQYEDAGYEFKVAATLDDCTESSAPVLVDGWAFLFPYVMHGGDEPNSTGPNGEMVFCEGDTLTLTLAPGYTENIEWTNNGIPLPNETLPVLTITTTGNYSASAAPGECPNSIMGIGVDVSATFNPPTQPEIIPDGTQLCAYPLGLSTQWYLIDVPLATTDCITMDGPGPYTVYVDYGEDCQLISEPYLATGIAPQAGLPFSISPMPIHGTALITWPTDLRPIGGFTIADLSGRTVMTGNIPAADHMQLHVDGLAPGGYFLIPQDARIAPARIVVAP